MKKIGTGTILIAVAALICVVAIAYILFALPAIRNEEDLLRTEMKIQEKDIAEIESAKGGQAELDSVIASMKERVEEREKAMEVTPDAIERNINEILGSLNISGSIELGSNNILAEAGEYAPEIRTQDLIVAFTCDRAGGETAMQLMEAIPNARLTVTAFIFEEGDEGEAVGNWMLSARLYYYEKGDGSETTADE
ncbi:MAG: hypothetical protein LBK04_06170 [Clostridiales Family XIII bacterium]|jgi:hypothetical protein|nr:hypothetical protein [Clostridiales Family XIII bacterium]